MRRDSGERCREVRRTAWNMSTLSHTMGLVGLEMTGHQGRVSNGDGDVSHQSIVVSRACSEVQL